MNKDFDIIDFDNMDEEQKTAAQEKAGIHAQVLSILVDELRAAVHEKDAEKSGSTEETAKPEDSETAEAGEPVKPQDNETLETQASIDTEEAEVQASNTESETGENEEVPAAEETPAAEERAEEQESADGYADEENAKEHVFQGEVSVDTLLLTDISEEIKRDLQETQVIDVSKVKMVGSETMPLIDLDSDLFEVIGGRTGSETDEKPYRSEREAAGYGPIEAEAEEAYETAEIPAEEYTEEADVTEEDENLSAEGDEYSEEEYSEEEYPEEEYSEEEYSEEEYYEEDEYYDEEEYAETEDDEELEFLDEDELDDAGETGENGYFEEEESEPEAADATVDEKEEQHRKKRSAERDKAVKAGNGKAKRSKSSKGKNKKKSVKISGKQAAERSKAPEKKGNSLWLKIAIAAIVLFSIGMTVWISARQKSWGQSNQSYMYEVGRSLSSIGVAGESGLMAMAEAEKSAQPTETPDTPDPGTGDTVLVPVDGQLVEVTFTSLEQDLKIKFIWQESRRLVTDVAFEVRLKPASGDEVVLTDADADGIIYEKGIKSGDYTVEVTAPDGYQFVGVPDSVNVREKIVYQQIDVAQEIKKESEINVAAEDTGVTLGAADAPQVTIPAAQPEVPTETPTPTPSPTPVLMNGDTVEWVESSKTPVSGGSGYKPVTKDSIAAPDQAKCNVEANIYDYASAAPCPGAAQSLVRTATEPGEPTPTPMPWMTTATPAATAEATPTPMPWMEATPTPTPESNTVPTVTATPTPTTSATATPTPTATATPTPEATATPTPTATVAATATPTATPTVTATPTPDPKQDTSTRLRDKNGNQIYIKNSAGEYVEATYADYYSKSEFYILSDTEYTYTGWQVINGNTYYFDRNGKKVTGEQQIQGVKYSFGADGVLKNNNTPTATPTPTPTPTAAPTQAPVNNNGMVIGIDASYVVL